MKEGSALRMLIIGSLILFQISCDIDLPVDWAWETVATDGEPTARHEAGLVAYNEELYLMGGRRINPTSVYDPEANTWKNLSPTPQEIHHFQPVIYDDKIYIIGAMTGQWPNETPIEKVIVFDPKLDSYEYTHQIPAHRQRGGAGVAIYNDKIYIVGGITHGHQNGYVSWLDEYDPKTGEWKILQDAPHNRDHFQAVVHEDKLYAFGGRRTSHQTGEDMDLTVSHGNIYDFKSGKWEDVTNNMKIPTERAGNGAFVYNGHIVIGGGESTAHVHAHDEIESYDTETGRWSKWPNLNQGRHGTGFAIIGDYVYTASGCGNRGGEPELTLLERLRLPNFKIPPIADKVDKAVVHKQYHPVTLNFEGPNTSESDQDNPFLNYALVINFIHEDKEHTMRGYYAADGNAAETSAKSGNIWEAKFTPSITGKWSYNATLYHGDSIAILDDFDGAEQVEISNSGGNIVVIASDQEMPNLKAKGTIIADNGFFKHAGTNQYLMKAGANSPENFLAYEGFDDTYRIMAEAREGEAAAPSEIHTYTPHIQDWKSGDPTWKNGSGKGIIGAINYLADKGMNSVYFLTMNILGDGKDVWPYTSPDNFTRFDVSKLAQWDILFEYMQAKGIMLHIVTQETENETLLDDGNTGPLRKLYYRELINRFSHHPGLIWNLGEENGPAEWTPIGQNDPERKAMASYIKYNDPYNHPVLLHTHSYDPVREDILNDIKGYEDIDGLSFQQNHREEVSHQIMKWKKRSKETGHEWLIAMDEIGEWHTAVKTDREDPFHPTIRRYALWGSLMSGAAGVEWYFGARHPHNDLTSEDWRQRDQLWDLTRIAKEFFDNYIPYWEMEAKHELLNSEGAFCLGKTDSIYTIYIPSEKSIAIDLSEAQGSFEVMWYNPLQGGELYSGDVETVKGGGVRNLGLPPRITNSPTGQDWVIHLEKNSK